MTITRAYTFNTGSTISGTEQRGNLAIQIGTVDFQNDNTWVSGPDEELGYIICTPKPDIVQKGLVLNLDAGNINSYPGSGEIWYDLSGNDNDMTLLNTTYNSGNLLFNGSSSYGDLGTDFTLSSQSATISSWVNVTDFTTLSGSHTQQARIFVTSSSRSHLSLIGFWNGGYGWETTTNSYPYEVASTNIAPVSSSAINPNNWFNFALVFDNNISYSYVNGIFITSIASNVNLNFRYLGIGSVNANYPDYLYGSIGNMIVYNKSLTSNEISQNYNAQKTRFGL